MIGVYRQRASRSARLLTKALLEVGAEAQRIKLRRDITIPSHLVSWGEVLDTVDRAVLNSNPIYSKLEELRTLGRARIPIPPYCAEHVEGWIPRSARHSKGRDFIGEVLNPAFYVQQIECVREFRLHIFKGVCIRAGLKTPRDSEAHPWVRSHSFGWKMDYGSACQQVLRQSHREVAKRAVLALGYDFGAVDLGIRVSTESPVVFEVNSAPGLDNYNTALAYAKKIKAWADEGTASSGGLESR